MERGTVLGGLTASGGMIAAEATDLLDGVPSGLLTGGGIGALVLFGLYMIFRGHLVPKGLVTQATVDQMRADWDKNLAQLKANWETQLADRDRQITTWHQAWETQVKAGERDRDIREQQADQIDQLVRGMTVLERFIVSLPRPGEGSPR